MRYIVYQQEECPETKKKHWQIYVEFEKTKRVKGVQKEIGDEKAHVEVRKGTREEARAYCMKEETRVGVTREHGIWKTEQGKRTDIHDLVNDVMAGDTLQCIIYKHASAYLKYHNGISKMVIALEGKRDWKPDVTIYWGKPGTGKTANAVFMCGKEEYFMTHNPKWWDGYEGHKKVIIDDFDPKLWDINYMLRLLDRYEFRVEIKGGSRSFLAKDIYITSNFNPKDWYKGDKQYEALQRRLDNINECE